MASLTADSEAPDPFLPVPPPRSSSADTPASRRDSVSTSSADSDASDVGEYCTECEIEHIRHRLVICVDGTWMVPDGAIGSFEGNASNMSRIWSMVKEGRVRDSDGTQWIQECITGHGYAAKIKQIYKLCCSLTCPRDEIFMFGFSRGAFVVRAVAGLLHHMQVMDIGAHDFDEKFDRAIALYRAAQDKSQLYENQVFRHLSETKKSPCVKFLGVIDTVKALYDDSLNDVGALSSVLHVRHALALFEKRTIMSPERFDLDKARTTLAQGNTIQEAWFVGTHENLGGSCSQDGLALWPLQWLVSEAKRQGLVLGFKRVQNSDVSNPAALILQRPGDPSKDYVCNGAVLVAMSDLSRSFSKARFAPQLDFGRSKFPSPQGFRPLFNEQGLIGQKLNDLTTAFIHPSVFYLDDTSPETVYSILVHPEQKALRAERVNSISSEDQIFWFGGQELKLLRKNKTPRILVCGQLNAGKSSLIAKIHGSNVTTIQHGAEPGQHDIDVPLTSSGSGVIFHDSQGFEAGKASNYDDVEEFLKHRRAEPYFEDQVHCVWYCVSTDLPRIQKVDKTFAKLQFGGVPVILVFTKTDKLKNSATEQALHEYNLANGTRFTTHELSSMPNELRESIVKRGETLLELEKEKRRQDWSRRLPVFSSTTFVANPRFSSTGIENVDELMQASNRAMSGDHIAQIHQCAQDQFIKVKWNRIVTTIIEHCKKNANWFDGFKRQDMTKFLQLQLRDIIRKIAHIFEFEGFRGTAIPSAILGILYPVSEEKNSFFRSVVPSIVGGVSATLMGPLTCVAAVVAVVSTLGVAGSLSHSHSLVAACMEVAFTMERIFWFGTKHIDEKLVTSATLYYLKRRNTILSTLKTRVKLFDNFQQMGPILDDVAEEFRYRRADPVHSEPGD